MRPGSEEGRRPRITRVRRLATFRYRCVKPLSILVDWFEMDCFAAQREGRDPACSPGLLSLYLATGCRLRWGGFFILAENWRSRRNGGSALTGRKSPVRAHSSVGRAAQLLISGSKVRVLVRPPLNQGLQGIPSASFRRPPRSSGNWPRSCFRAAFGGDRNRCSRVRLDRSAVCRAGRWRPAARSAASVKSESAQIWFKGGAVVGP